jgi:hypothetical protein
MEKLDFNKRFFEPILEEKELEPAGFSKRGSVRVKKAPRNIINTLSINNSPGIVSNIDSESANNADFKHR